MRLATCSYQEFRPDMGIGVRISLSMPRWHVPGVHADRKVWMATPRYSYLNGTDEEYEKAFVAQLDEFGAVKFQDLFHRMWEEAGGDQPLVLLCFEKLGAKTHRPAPGLSLEDAESLICHRRLFAKWWKQQTGEEIPELGTRAVLPGVLPDTPGSLF